MKIPLRLVKALAVLGLGTVLLAGCSQSTVVTATPTSASSIQPTATPTIAGGTYVFIRNGNLWLRTGFSRAHSFTTLNLPDNIGTWGSFSWSPDHTRFAFALRANPIAPGDGNSSSVQGTGTLYIGDVSTGAIRGLAGSTLAVKIPLQGQHTAWIDNNNLLITQNGTVQKLNLGQGPGLIGSNATISAVTGPRTVWDIAYHNDTLFYSTVANLQSNGTGTAELHSFTLTASPPIDKVIATLGSVTLLATDCGGFICPFDTSTPFVPFAWAISANGKQVTYQTGTLPGNKDATAIAGSNLFYTTQVDRSQPATTIFTSVPQPTAQVSLTFAPNGQQIVLALVHPAQTLFGPYIQIIGNSAVRQLAVPDTFVNKVVLGGPVSWSPDGLGVSITAQPIDSTTTKPTSLTFTLTGQSAITETNALQLSWAS